jgi:hypothetical protein
MKKLLSLTAIGSLGLTLAAPIAARCLDDQGCGKRRFERVSRCFKMVGACRTDSKNPRITCWQNGARTIFSAHGNARYITRFVGAHGRLCQVAVSSPSPEGFTVTYIRIRRRKWVYEHNMEGVRVTCPNGEVESYTAAELASPECLARAVGESVPDFCEVGRCRRPE